jgi:hypothetical protein
VLGAVADEGGGVAGEAEPLGRLLHIEVDAESAAVALAATGLHHRGYRIAAGFGMPDVLGEIAVPRRSFPDLSSVTPNSARPRWPGIHSSARSTYAIMDRS